MPQIFFTSSGSFANPGDWDNANNKIECLGSGGNGAGSYGYAGSGGAYAWAANVSPVFPVAVTIANAATTAFANYCTAASGENAGPQGGSDVYPAGYRGGTAGAGGGGAAGPAGVGGDGGSSGYDFGGSANGGTTSGPAPGGGAGRSGTEWGVYGCGTGGASNGTGGSYGGGGGGYNAPGYPGRNGLIVITYTPFIPPPAAIAMVIG